MHFTYSRWDGTQDSDSLDPGDLLDALSDDLLAEGNLHDAILHATSWGFHRQDGPEIPGLKELARRLRVQRQQELELHDIDRVVEDLARKVAEMADRERTALPREGGVEGGEDTPSRPSVLDHVPGETARAMASRTRRDFFDGPARAQFEAVTDNLRRHAVEGHDGELRSAPGDLSGATLDAFHEMRGALDGRRQDNRGETTNRIISRMHDLDGVEDDLARAHESGDLAGINLARVERVLGAESRNALECLQRISQLLEEAGYLERTGDSIELTARGIRRIGQKVLGDIFSHLSHDTFGNHIATRGGDGSDHSDASKAYEFGDPFVLDLGRTLMQAVMRAGKGSPLRLNSSDFHVWRTLCSSQASTVLMVDMSRSMPLRGCHIAAKKVALALNSLIRSRFPRDTLYVVAFSDYARRVRADRLHRISGGADDHGTNMQHGFMLARNLLGRHNLGTRQIILITDGEPTAYVEGVDVHFSYPPTARTFDETLKEVKRCTREGIVINTFMLERSHYLADFVSRMTRVNHGRAFFATPERLGDYVLMDYVNAKRTVRR